MTQQSVAAQNEWSGREELAEAMIPLIGRLYRKNNVVTSIYGRKLINKSPIDILKAHRVARHIDGVELSPSQTLPLLQGLDALDLGAVSVDLARLARKFNEQGNGVVLQDFLAAEFAERAGGAGRTCAARSARVTGGEAAAPAGGANGESASPARRTAGGASTVSAVATSDAAVESSPGAAGAAGAGCTRGAGSASGWAARADSAVG